MIIDNIVKIIEAISTVLWPIITLIIILLFKSDISTFLNRIKRGTLFGNEIELADEIDDLREVVSKSKNEIPEDRNPVDDYSQKIIEFSTQNPRTGLLELAIEIEKTVKNIMYSSGWYKSINIVSIPSSVDFLVKKGVIPKNTLSSLKIFWDVRNKIIHSRGKTSDQEIIKVIDIGLTLLRTLKIIPQTKHTVYNTNIEIYKNKECTIIDKDVVGIILEEKSPGKSITNYRIYPTKRRDYKVGLSLSWEWDMNTVFEDRYYIDPETHEKKCAWNSSAEFIGRDLEQL
ncbi:hypothetical protein [Spirochaeta isovalerica]|uniref:DUF4145 domain-containing protein n=1 Tax=Spirochaeta isovalerica TaxID=150 RepID=A0A841RF66_9SPIO|nr:hypothetical protein [Spirochaeta isovalerica]MBB6482725.1 hypothetical protein [Spirochaeta isovalerica]